MTAKQRRKQNRLNAQNSTGPKTEEGKAASRRNALKHGLTAEVLCLPTENPLEIRIQSEAFHEAFDPQSHDEDVLVDQVVISALRLDRFTVAETAILSEQVRNAELQWDLAQQTRVVDLSRLMRTDPAKAVLELKSFAAGANWLLGRWQTIKKALDTRQCLTNFNALLDVLRLCGFQPDTLKEEQIDAYELMLTMVSCLNKKYKKMSEYTDYLRVQMPHLWLGMNRPKEFPMAESTANLRVRIEAELADAQALADLLAPIAVASRAGAKARAMIPADTSQNRLMLRYRTSAEMTFNRSVKTLEKIQTDREKVAVAEAEKEDPRNEPIVQGKTSSTRVFPGSYVDLNGVRYQAQEVSGDKLILGLALPRHDSTLETVRATPPDVV